VSEQLKMKTHTEEVRFYTDVLKLSAHEMERFRMETSVSSHRVPVSGPCVTAYGAELAQQLKELVSASAPELHARTRAALLAKRDAAARHLQTEYLEACQQAGIDPFTGQPKEVQP